MASLSPPPPPPPNLRHIINRSQISASINSKNSPNPSNLGGGKRPWWTPLIFKNLHRNPPFEKRRIDEEDDDGGEIGDDGSSTKRSGRLTAEKAKVLRREMRSTDTWHDAMYHSAIASRLASPDNNVE